MVERSYSCSNSPVDQRMTKVFDTILALPYGIELLFKVWNRAADCQREARTAILVNSIPADLMNEPLVLGLN
jgi:hypothetical protein